MYTPPSDGLTATYTLLGLLVISASSQCQRGNPGKRLFPFLVGQHSFLMALSNAWWDPISAAEAGSGVECNTVHVIRGTKSLPLSLIRGVHQSNDPALAGLSSSSFCPISETNCRFTNICCRQSLRSITAGITMASDLGNVWCDREAVFVGLGFT
jgi:hypothetical protein